MKLTKYLEVLTWIKSLLSGRRQKVDIGDRHFSRMTVLSGVPQGSVFSTWAIPVHQAYATYEAA